MMRMGAIERDKAKHPIWTVASLLRIDLLPAGAGGQSSRRPLISSIVAE
jgi:hypothetical protein